MLKFAARMHVSITASRLHGIIMETKYLTIIVSMTRYSFSQTAMKQVKVI